MKIPCPSCGKVMRLGDGLEGKLARCPACRQTFAVPKTAPQTEAQTLPVPAAPAEIEDELAIIAPDFDEKPSGTAAPDPAQTETCPHCGARWTKGQPFCGKCNFNVLTGHRTKDQEKYKYRFRLDYHKTVMCIAGAAVLAGILYVFINWPAIKRKLGGLFDDPVPQQPAAGPEKTPPPKPVKKLSRD